MVALYVAGLIALGLIGVVFAVFARNMVAWQVRSHRNLESGRRQYIESFISYSSRVIFFETWALRICGSAVALGAAFFLAMLLASRLST